MGVQSLCAEEGKGSQSFKLYQGVQAALFYGAYGAWLAVALLNTSVLSPFLGKNNVVYYVVAVCFAVVELLGLRHEGRKGILFLALLALLNVQTFVIGHNDLLIFSMLMVCGRRADFKRVITITVVVSVVVSVALAVLSCVGIIPDVTNVRVDGTIRHALGYGYVTYLSYVFMNVAFLVIYRRSVESALRPIDVAVLMIINIIIFIICQARNAFFIVTAALVVVSVFQWCLRTARGLNVAKRVWLVCRQAAVWVFPAMAVLSLALGFFYLVAPQSDVAVFLDGVLSTRLQKMAHAIKMIGLPLIGGTDMTLSDVLVIDNSYLRIVYEHGVVTLVVVLVMWTYAMWKAARFGDVCMVWLMALVACCAVVDAQLISFQQNTLLFAVSWCMPGGVVQFKKSRLVVPDGY